MTQSTVGSYILLIRLPEEATITIGSRRGVHFSYGHYAYVGSAMRGLKARLDRHLRRDKRLHWHIDYLLERASVTGIILCETERRVECAIAQALKPQFDSVPGFGSSDCRCPSHLFYAASEPHLKSTVMATLHSLGMEPRLDTAPAAERQRDAPKRGCGSNGEGTTLPSPPPPALL